MAFLDRFHYGEAPIEAGLESRRENLRERLEAHRPPAPELAEGEEIYVDRPWVTIDDPRDGAQTEPRTLQVSPDLAFTKDGCSVHVFGMHEGEPEFIGSIHFWDHLSPAVNVYTGQKGDGATHSWYSADADLLLKIAESAMDQQSQT